LAAKQLSLPHTIEKLKDVMRDDMNGNVVSYRNARKGLTALMRLVGRRVLCALWLTACLATATPAAAATYAYRNDTFAYDTPSGSATSVTWHASSAAPACTQYPQGDDDWADVTFPAGFTFTFGGVAYTSVRIYSNGILAFGTDVSGFHRDYTPVALPAPAGPTYTGCATAAPVNVMLAYWIDIVAGTANGTTGASVKYEMLGTAPDRRFVISWDNVKLYNQAARYSFQVALYESTSGANGNFRYQYTTGSSNGSNATVGVQLNATDYTQYSYNQQFIDTTNGTAILWYPANQLIAKGAEYRFDEGAWTGAAGEITDTSGSGQDASRVGAAANIAAGKLCRGGSFTSNTSNNTIDAVATPIVPANTGAVDFWYKSTNAWNSANTMLFDATTVAARPFFLMKRNTGALRFVITDSAGTARTAETTTGYTYAANTWHHVGVSWNIKPGTNQTVQQIFLDGVLVTTTTTTPYRSTTTGTIATLSTLYIGDNRTAGVTPSNGTPNGANGTIDEVYIYPIDINASQAAADMALTRPTCGTVDHFHIIHNGGMVNCGNPVASITVEAHDATHGLISLAGTTMQMSTSTGHGTWSSVSTINPVNNTGSGNGNYTFSNEASIVLGLSNTFFEALNINLSSGAVTEHSGAAASCVSQDYTSGTTCDADFSFSQAGIIFSTSANGPVATLPAQVAGTSSGTYYLRAVQANTATKACESALSGANTVNVAYECNNPTACSGSNLMSVNGGAATTIARNNNGSVSSYSSVNMTFDANGNAPFTFNYSDVGQVTLWANKTLGSVTLSGSSNAFVVKPHHFVLSNIVRTSDSFANPGAVDQNGARFIGAGENFTVTATAVDALNIATPNYGKEIVPESVRLTPTPVAPLGGANPAIGYTTGFGGFTNGAATGADFKWNEVGIVTLTPGIGDSNYLGAGDVTGTASGNIGRFTPAYFDITTVTPGCNSAFTYAGLMPVGPQPSVSGQPFTVIATAKNLSGTTTQNFDGPLGFAKNTTFSDAGTATNFTNNTLLAAGYTLGVGQNSIITYRFTSKETAPQTLTLRAVDTDSVSSAGHAELTTEVRSGRVHLYNAYGSELVDLPMPMRAEYYSATDGWITNPNDGCTSVALGSLIPSNPMPVVGSSPVKTTNASIAHAPFVAGDAGLQLSAPMTGGTGYVDLTADLTANAWLKYDWNGTGTAVNPTGRATFGIYRASPKHIYLRER
jgi:MSHA biogenesis protein MshQ